VGSIVTDAVHREDSYVATTDQARQQIGVVLDAAVMMQQDAPEFFDTSAEMCDLVRPSANVEERDAIQVRSLVTFARYDEAGLYRSEFLAYDFRLPFRFYSLPPFRIPLGLHTRQPFLKRYAASRFGGEAPFTIGNQVLQHSLFGIWCRGDVGGQAIRQGLPKRCDLHSARSYDFVQNLLLTLGLCLQCRLFTL
jgi:hypothetical protein